MAEPTLRIPTATYRLQFNAGFTFRDARALVPYLDRLGVTDLYASSLVTARKGSAHGYDVTDPTRLNPELGTEEDFRALAAELKERGMGLLLDIVPNHMAASAENAWWMDVLESGRSSPYAAFFDIEWQRPGARPDEMNRVLLPIAGRPYKEALASGEIKLHLDERGLAARYYEHRLPLDPKSYATVLARALDGLRGRLGPEDGAARGIARLLAAIESFPDRDAAGPDEAQARHGAKEEIKRDLWQLYQGHPEARRFLDESIASINGDAGVLGALLDAQAYRPGFWRTDTARINYRRFFDISDLAGVRVERPDVFAATHALILDLVWDGSVTGLRVDHIDGLYDPLGYLRRLQEHASGREGERGFYIVVEKILTGDEALPDDWPVDGTTGYDFLNTVNGVFVDQQGLTQLTETCSAFTGSRTSFRDTVYQAKKRALKVLFQSEARRLSERLAAIAAGVEGAGGLTPEELLTALIEVTACFPAYRSYVRGFRISPGDRARVEFALSEAARRSPDLSRPTLDLLRRVLLLDAPSSLPEDQREKWIEFVMRWQQLTGPATAKGLEDTALYLHNPLVSINDVGADPEGTGAIGVEAFHERNLARAERCPHTLNATSTHDTKRSEDVRARINVLSELPSEWAACLERWSGWNRARRVSAGGGLAPDANEETLLYQTLLGAWPLDGAELPEFRERLKRYLVKALREAKTHTSWLDPDPAYEDAVTAFAEAILEQGAGSEFPASFLAFQTKVAFHGAMNSLAQVLLKIASPGAPDLYQGAELWDFSLADPDNRRPVDFARRARLLRELQARQKDDTVDLARELLAGWRDGRIKLLVTSRALGFRRANAALFRDGAYLPLAVEGERSDHAVAFARTDGESWAIAVAPRLVTRLSPPGEPPLGREAWGETSLVLPGDAPARWRNELTGEKLDAGQGALPLASVFEHLPVALLSATGIGIPRPRRLLH